MKGKKYTKEEDEYLRKNYKTKSRKKMSEELGRTVRSIEKRCLSVLKLKKSRKDQSNTRKQENNEKNRQEREKSRGQVPEDWFDLPSSFVEGEEKKTKYVFTGKPCARGHIDLRFTVHGSCLACCNEDSLQRNKAPQRREWRSNYRKRPEVRAAENKTRRTRREDPVFKFRTNVSSRLARAMAGEKLTKSKETEEYLGCTWEEFKEWIESQFNPSMTIENYGYKGWHLDHVRPCDSFDLNDDNQIFVAFNWANFQPLWGEENFDKNNDYSPLDELAWVERMQALGYEGELFLKYEEGNSY